MPKLGNTVEECLLATWRKHKGDTVAAGDVIAEVETDKATFEVTATAGGILLDTFYPEGALVPVFASICAIGAAGEAAPVSRQPTPESSAPPDAAERTGPQALGPRAAEPQGRHPGAALPDTARRPETARPLSPRARRFADVHDFVPPPQLAGSGPGGRVLEPDVRAAFHSAPRLSDAAKAKLADGYTAPRAGSGIGGLILAGDLATVAASSPAMPLSAVRRRIADRLRAALSTTAQYTLHRSANAAGLLAARRTLKANQATANITINDLVVCCAIRALGQVPGLNAEFTDGMLRQHAGIHLAFACDTDRGLMVPVVRDSQSLSLAELSSRMRELADQAITGTIGPDDLAGGTFTVSNLGSLGIESFTPLLNPPQVAILGVDAISVKPVRKPDGNIEFIDAIGLSLTVDHQVIDGVPGARFLTVLAREIENAEQLCTT